MRTVFRLCLVNLSINRTRILLCLIAIICLTCTIQIDTFRHVAESAPDYLPSMQDSLVCLFAGRVFDQNLGNVASSITWGWTICNLLMVYLISTAALQIYRDTESRMIIESRMRVTWWVAKIALIVLLSFVTYAVIGLSAVIMVLLHDGVMEGGLSMVMLEYIGLDPTNISDTNLTIWPSLGLSWAAMLSICMMLFTLSVLLNQIIGFVSALTMIVFGLFYQNPFIIGNWLMATRNSTIALGGLSPAQGVMVMFVLNIVLVGFGFMFFHRKDLFD